MTETKIDFPQPEVEAPKDGDQYFAISSDGSVSDDTWNSHCRSDKDRLSIGNVYLTRAEAEQRSAWNKQDMARRVVPKWLRDLGPDVEVFSQNQWVPLKDASSIDHWDQRCPQHFRAKPKPAPDVVVNVNGKEYRWPATAKQGDPQGDRFLIQRHHGFVVTAFCNSELYGDFSHHTREGAKAQCAALNAALGIEQGGAA